MIRQSAIHLALVEGPVDRAAVRHHRRAGAHDDVDVQPRDATTGRAVHRRSISTTARALWCASRSGIKAGKELNGATVCVSQGTTNELNLADFARTNNIKIQVADISDTNETGKGYESGRCDVYTTDRSQLAANRLKFAKPDDHVLLPDVISKEPLGAWVRKGDDQWFTLVRWVLFAMLNAEELGVTQANLDEMLKSTNPEIKRLLGIEGAAGEQLGVSKDWVVRILRHVGNYGESFERHLGPKTRIGLDRGPNRLWTDGGLQYAPPIR